MERKRGVEDRIVLITISGTEAANSLRWEGFFFFAAWAYHFHSHGRKGWQQEDSGFFVKLGKRPAYHFAH
jgi:hypothetical protein